MFGAAIEARLAGHSQDTQRMQRSIENLYKQHEGLYKKTESTFGSVVNQVAELKTTQAEALENERRIRKRHEQTLRDSAAVLDEKLEGAHRQIDYERQTREKVSKEAQEAQAKWAAELKKVKDIQKRLKQGLSVDMSTLDLGPEEIPLPLEDDEDWRSPISSLNSIRARTEELEPGERRPPTGNFYAQRRPDPIVIDGVTYGQYLHNPYQK
jgi:chromosome segregation ATPase